METLEVSSDEEKADYGLIKEKIPRRLETLHLQADAEAAAGHAGDFGDLKANFQLSRSAQRGTPDCSVLPVRMLRMARPRLHPGTIGIRVEMRVLRVLIQTL